ncbi:MAG: chemotaxis protein [Gammaproteobacteria bacterium]|nr:chemotaxis protein [Gammaproteobacteria bacterium]
MSHAGLNELRASFVGVADATFAFQGQLQRRLREIDRKALNAQVLVKRHGKILAGYGVVAQSFREGAQQLQEAAADVQKAIQPLMLGFMETLRDTQQIEKLGALPVKVRQLAPALQQAMRRHEQTLAVRRDQSRRASTRLRQALARFEHVVAELEYVVVNGRIEAALKGDARTALTQVSTDMDNAVVQVRDLLRQYAEHIEKVLP